MFFFLCICFLISGLGHLINWFLCFPSLVVSGLCACWFDHWSLWLISWRTKSYLIRVLPTNHTAALSLTSQPVSSVRSGKKTRQMIRDTESCGQVSLTPVLPDYYRKQKHVSCLTADLSSCLNVCSTDSRVSTEVNVRNSREESFKCDTNSWKMTKNRLKTDWKHWKQTENRLKTQTTGLKQKTGNRQKTENRMKTDRKQAENRQKTDRKLRETRKNKTSVFSFKCDSKMQITQNQT